LAFRSSNGLTKPEAGQPPQGDREQEDHHDAEPEVRRGEAPQRDRIGAVIPRRIALDRRHDTHRNADRERDDDRERGELERHRQLFEDQLAHRLLHPQRFAEVAAQHAFDPVQVANRQRLVQVHLLAQVRDHGRIAVLAGEHDGGIARQQLLQAEDQHRHEDQCRDDRRDAADEVGKHCGWPGSAGAGRVAYPRSGSS
jgi:hypothetical protein